MNNLHKFAEFTTVEEGEKNLKKAYEIRDQMGWGTLLEYL